LQAVSRRVLGHPQRSRCLDELSALVHGHRRLGPHPKGCVHVSGLTNALTQARAGRYDLLLVYRVDRLARSVRGLAQILEDLDTAGVAFRSATEPFDTSTPAGRMMVQMLGVSPSSNAPPSSTASSPVGMAIDTRTLKEGLGALAPCGVERPGRPCRAGHSDF
jgi:hypothetical protein